MVKVHIVGFVRRLLQGLISAVTRADANPYCGCSNQLLELYAGDSPYPGSSFVEGKCPQDLGARCTCCIGRGLASDDQEVGAISDVLQDDCTSLLGESACLMPGAVSYTHLTLPTKR